MSGTPIRAADSHCAVAIVGGGMVGASLALCLAHSAHKVVLIEAQAPGGAQQPSFDDRTTALGNGARRVYATLQIWPSIAAAAAPIRQIHISDAGRFGFARLDAAEHDLTAFGYTVGNRELGAVLWAALRECSEVEIWSPARVTAVALGSEQVLLTVQSPAGERTLAARLAVAADGADSLLKRAVSIASDGRPYDQTALVTNVRTDCAAGATAYERFTDSGPMALLPRRDGSYAFIWTLPPARAAEMQACEEQDFCQQAQQRFGFRAGRFEQIARRSSYPLQLLRARSSVGRRMALIGNAAQTLHPVAAQGFNLGLRDAAMLAELTASATDPGAEDVLGEFARRRATDRGGMIAFTDRLVRLFAERSPALAAARDLGLLLFDLTPPAKRALSRVSWGFGALPRLSRGVRLASSRASADISAEESGGTGVP